MSNIRRVKIENEDGTNIVEVNDNNELKVGLDSNSTIISLLQKLIEEQKETNKYLRKIYK